MALSSNIPSKYKAGLELEQPAGAGLSICLRSQRSRGNGNAFSSSDGMALEQLKRKLSKPAEGGREFTIAIELNVNSASANVLKDATNLKDVNIKGKPTNESQSCEQGQGQLYDEIATDAIQGQIRGNLEKIKRKFDSDLSPFHFRLPRQLKATIIPGYRTKSLPIGRNEQISSNSLWNTQSPIYVANASQWSQGAVSRILIPKRKRGLFCYLCGQRNGQLSMCGESCCPTQFHESCARSSVLGNYTFKFMQRNNKTYCSMHHCTACFADHNRSRCFYGKLVNCDQCELAWHVDCIPGGCELNSKREITCPRHASFADSPYLHFRHCADCQQEPHECEELVRCTNCFRSLHFKCYKEQKMVLAEAVVNNIKEAEERANIMCHWCDMFDFVRYGEFAMARLAHLKWYPCQVVPNDQYPNQSDPFLRSVGFVCVKWLPYRGKTFFNLISHSRVIAMTNRDYFFVTQAKNTSIFEEWKLAQQHALVNSPLHKPLNEDQKPDMMTSNGERLIRKIIRNRYSKPELKTPRERLLAPDLCKCLPGDDDRCGPSSSCINRTLRMECPAQCDELPNKKCNNRGISKGDNCIKVEIKYFHGKGYGAIALEDVSQGGFVGEYVGEVIDDVEKKRRLERIASLQSNEAQYYIMELDDKRAIDAQYYGNNMRYVNHSCKPNCVIQQFQSDVDIHLVLMANRNIHKGEELSFDYNMKGRGRAVPICHCGEKNCTGVLSAGTEIKKTMYDWEGEKPKLVPNLPAVTVTKRKAVDAKVGIKLGEKKALKRSNTTGK